MFVEVTRLPTIGRGEMVRGRIYTVLGKVPLLDHDLALAARLAAAADRLDFDAERARCVQQVRAVRDFTLAAGRLEHNTMSFG